MPQLAMLGEVIFSVIENENPEYSNIITEKEVEEGDDVTDHVRPMPIIFGINGLVVGEDAAAKLIKLKEYRDKGAVLTYVGRNAIGNLVIQTFSPQHNAGVANGFSFTLTLKQIRIAKSQTIQLQAPVSSNKASTQVKGKGNNGKQQIQQKDADPEKKQSLLYKAIKKMGGNLDNFNFSIGGNKGSGGGGTGGF